MLNRRAFFASVFAAPAVASAQTATVKQKCAVCSNFANMGAPTTARLDDNFDKSQIVVHKGFVVLRCLDCGDTRWSVRVDVPIE
jgi:hypothetical protein